MQKPFHLIPKSYWNNMYSKYQRYCVYLRNEFMEYVIDLKLKSRLIFVRYTFTWMDGMTSKHVIIKTSSGCVLIQRWFFALTLERRSTVILMMQLMIQKKYYDGHISSRQPSRPRGYFEEHNFVIILFFLLTVGFVFPLINCK